MKRQINVFIGSPGDLASERKVFRDVIDELNDGWADGANVKFVALGWEDTLASTGRRNQSVINEEVDKCDVFILTMHRRWGQPAPDAAPYSSYTEEEFYRALERWKRDGNPEIFVFFKKVDAASEADAGPELLKVLAFRRQLEETRQIMYKIFDAEEAFANLVSDHLKKFAKGALPKTQPNADMVLLPLAALEEVNKAKREVERHLEAAAKAHDDAEEKRLQLEELYLIMAEDAAALSKEGKVEFARQKFVKLVSESSNPSVLTLAFDFFERTGDLDVAVLSMESLLSISAHNSEGQAVAYGNLGVVYKTRGDLDKAEEMYLKSLAIEEALGRKEGMASDYGNLGIVYQVRGDLDKAEEMYRKSLAIEEALGRKEGRANQYGNLGNVYKTRGDLDKAEEMYRKSLAIEEALGRKEGMASDYGNLGNVYQTRGDLDKAKDMFLKSLAINDALGRKEGVANQYGNLGIVYQARGDLDKAEEMYRKSLAINEALGRKEGMASDYGNLGIVYKARGDLDKAEEMYLKSLAISALLGHKEYTANQYGNLGNVYQTRGDLDKAEEMYRKSLAINEALGRKEGMAKQYGNLGIVYHTRGDLDKAEHMYRKSLALFVELGSPNVGVVMRNLARLEKAQQAEPSL